MNMPRWKMTLIMLAMIAMLLLAAFTMGHDRAAVDLNRNLPAAPLPTLAPTQAIIVPTPPPAPVTFYGDGNSYTYNITVNETNVTSCAAVIGCWQR